MWMMRRIFPSTRGINATRLPLSPHTRVLWRAPPPSAEWTREYFHVQLSLSTYCSDIRKMAHNDVAHLVSQTISSYYIRFILRPSWQLLPGSGSKSVVSLRRPRTISIFVDSEGAIEESLHPVPSFLSPPARLSRFRTLSRLSNRREIVWNWETRTPSV